MLVDQRPLSYVASQLDNALEDGKAALLCEWYGPGPSPPRARPSRVFA